MHELNAVLAIGYRDFMKFVRDRPRLLGTFIFPLVFIAVLGGTLQANLGKAAGFDLLVFTFTGIFAQSLFQSSALGIISLVEDRLNDFSQAIFVAPISRYSILIGKILGETSVALVQGLGILGFGMLLGIHVTLVQAAMLIPIAVVVAFFGGAFGLLILSTIGFSRRAAEQLFPLIFLPQFFLAGVFNPIRELPPIVDILSHLAPLRYGVDLVRSVFYLGSPEYDKVVLHGLFVDSLVVGILSIVFLVAGTALFVRNEHNR